MTKKNMFATIINFLKAEESADFILVQNEDEVITVKDAVSALEHEIELLDSKKSSSKPTKTQIENENLKDVILATLVSLGKPATVTQIMESNSALPQSNQKITSLLTQMRASGKVDKTVEKKVSYYFVVSAE